MIFYKIYVDGIYQFKDFEMDLTYARESRHSPIKQQLLNYPNVKFKKVNILLGANASGKTSFGKVVCTIQNFIRGKDIGNLDFGPMSRMFNKLLSEQVVFKTIFSVGDYLYGLDVAFNHSGLIYEEWKIIPLSNKHINSLIRDLYEKPEIHEVLKQTISGQPPIFRSVFLTMKEYEKHKFILENNLGFIYSFSDVGVEKTKFNHLSELELLEKILISFDNSVKSVRKSKDDPNNTVITFKNGDIEILFGGEITSKEHSILSTGTKEAIFLAHLILGLKNKMYNTLYVDEKMSDSHSEIEQQIIQIMISLAERHDCQLFVTSHNTDLLELNLPNYNFALFKKNQDGKIKEIIQPELSSKHQNRSIRKIIEEDVFGTSPNLENLILLHDALIND